MFLTKKFAGLLIGTSLVVAGCTTHPDKIKAQHIPTSVYDGFSCEQIGNEVKTISSRLNSIVKDQKKASSTDKVAVGVGIVLFWPALFALALTDDQKDEIAQLRGKYTALHKVSVDKGCPIPPPQHS